MSNENLEDVFQQVDGETDLPVEQDHKNKITAKSVKIDNKVRTIEGITQYWQDILNNWRKTITQNEQIIIIMCIFIGIIYSYAVNKCTGNINVPPYAYVMSGIIIVLISLLLIAERSLPLLVLIKFAVSVAGGHLAMMYLVAVDGHGWGLFTDAVCRYPVTTNTIMAYIFGVGSGIIASNFKIGGDKK